MINFLISEGNDSCYNDILEVIKLFGIKYEKELLIHRESSMEGTLSCLSENKNDYNVIILGMPLIDIEDNLSFSDNAGVIIIDKMKTLNIKTDNIILCSNLNSFLIKEKLNKFNIEYINSVVYKSDQWQDFLINLIRLIFVLNVDKITYRNPITYLELDSMLVLEPSSVIKGSESNISYRNLEGRKFKNNRFRK